ncbi:hypothetical protein OIO90_000141 [Microbotryomycetes sp. JL221]|nr:hypothetical protein OIO90_000141 [Microbotryomycetes sp. JL221]
MVSRKDNTWKPNIDYKDRWSESAICLHGQNAIIVCAHPTKTTLAAGQSVEIQGSSESSFKVTLDNERQFHIDQAQTRPPLFRIVGLEPKNLHTIVLMRGGDARGTLTVESIKIMTASNSDERPELVALDSSREGHSEAASLRSQATTSTAESRTRSDSVLRTAPSGFVTSVRRLTSESASSFVQPTTPSRSFPTVTGSFADIDSLPTNGPYDALPSAEDAKSGSGEAVKAAIAIVATLVGLALLVVFVTSCRIRRQQRQQEKMVEQRGAQRISSSDIYRGFAPPPPSTLSMMRERHDRNIGSNGQEWGQPWFARSSMTSTTDGRDSLQDTRRFYKLSDDTNDSSRPSPVLTSHPSPEPFSSFSSPPRNIVNQNQLPAALVPSGSISKRGNVRFATKPPSLILRPQSTSTAPDWSPSTSKSSSWSPAGIPNMKSTRDRLSSISECNSPVQTPTFAGSEVHSPVDPVMATSSTLAQSQKRTIAVNVIDNVADAPRANFFQAQNIGGIEGDRPKYSVDKGDPRSPKHNRQTM